MARDRERHYASAGEAPFLGRQRDRVILARTRNSNPPRRSPGGFNSFLWSGVHCKSPLLARLCRQRHPLGTAAIGGWVAVRGYWARRRNLTQRMRAGARCDRGPPPASHRWPLSLRSNDVAPFGEAGTGPHRLLANMVQRHGHQVAPMFHVSDHWLEL